MNQYLLFTTIACVLIAATIDVFTNRIPNWVTLPSVLLGVTINSSLGGSRGLILSGLGLITGFLLLFFVYLLGGMGGGDVKLLSAVGALLGPRLVFYAFIWMALAGGALALVLILYKKAFSQTFRNLRTLLLGWILRMPHDASNLTIKNQSLIKLPYGVAIAIGVILAVWLKRIPNLGL